jgi:hypothetical protein
MLHWTERRPLTDEEIEQAYQQWRDSGGEHGLPSSAESKKMTAAAAVVGFIEVFAVAGAALAVWYLWGLFSN